MTPRSVSGSSRSPSAVEPTTSQNSNVTVLRDSLRGVGTRASSAPQAPQNRNPGGLSVPQLAQTTRRTLGLDPHHACETAGRAVAAVGVEVIGLGGTPVERGQPQHA